MCHRLQCFIHLWAHGLKDGTGAPGLHSSWATARSALPYHCHYCYYYDQQEQRVKTDRISLPYRGSAMVNVGKLT